jgi:O-glycosyl hydrolase
MKAYIAASFFLLVAFISGCTTKEYYEVVPSMTIIYQKTASQWMENSTYDVYTDLAIPELTKYYVEQGIVTVALSFDNENSYNGLPATIDGVSYSFDYRTGNIRIYAQDPIMEEGIEVFIPERIHLKVSLTEANYVE